MAKKKAKKAEMAKASEQTLHDKWGVKTIDVLGWTAIPNILLERQRALNIDSVKLNILLVLIKHWWEKPRMPFPSKATIADIIGKDMSTVQRHIRQMEDNKLLVRNDRFKPVSSGGGQIANEYDLSGLLTKLDEYAKAELKEQEKQDESEGRKRRGRVGSHEVE